MPPSSSQLLPPLLLMLDAAADSYELEYNSLIAFHVPREYELTINQSDSTCLFLFGWFLKVLTFFSLLLALPLVSEPSPTLLTSSPPSPLFLSSLPLLPLTSCRQEGELYELEESKGAGECQQGLSKKKSVKLTTKRKLRVKAGGGCCCKESDVSSRRGGRRRTRSPQSSSSWRRSGRRREKRETLRGLTASERFAAAPDVREGRGGGEGGGRGEKKEEEERKTHCSRS
eukprot:340881-Hanusia_phi.AAC.2